MANDTLEREARAAARFVAAVVLIAALLASCKASGSAASASSPAASRALRVRTANVAVQDVTYQVKAVGTLEAEELVQVTAEVDGAVSQVRFHEGDRVTADTVLARIDPDRYRLEAERAEATWRRSVADATRAQADFERREQLASERLVAAEELNTARADSQRFDADAAANKAAAELAAQNLRRSSVRPPRAGTINSRSVETGQFVRAGAVLATLVDTRRLRLRFKIGEGESLRTKEGEAVRFRVSPLGPRVFEGKIYHVGDLADPATRQVEVLAWVRNTGELKPGFFAEVDLATETHRSATVVPEGAIQATDKGFVVYAVQDGKARQRPVQIGLRTSDGIVEILSGLSGGDVVVTEGSDRLADGMAVQNTNGEPNGGGPASRGGRADK